MHQQNNVFPISNQSQYFGSATVIDDENASGEVVVRWLQEGKTTLANAKVACSRKDKLLSQTEVLIAGPSAQSMYVIGLLDIALSEDAPVVETLKTDNGASAQINKSGLNDSIAVYSESDELIFEYDPVTKISKVNMQQGDLEINAKQGNISLNAGKEVEVNGGEISLNSKRLSIKAYVGEMVLGKLETVAETLIENSKNVYRSVKELSQLRSGRMRTIVDETYQLNADKVLTKSENDFKVKAEKIHLG